MCESRGSTKMNENEYVSVSLSQFYIKLKKQKIVFTIRNTIKKVSTYV